MNPAVSIIVSLYNKQRHIAKTLRCALNQDFGDFEVIVVNDGSTDGSGDEVKAFADARISYFETENRGVSAARNYGIAKSSGRLIAFLDADDLWHPNHLSQLISLERDYPNCGLYCSDYQMQFSETNTYKPKFPDLPDFPWRGVVSDFFASSYIDRIAWTSALAVPKNVLEDIGTFNENITLGAGEDLDLWIRIAVKYPVAFDSEITATHNLMADNRMSLTKTKHRKFAPLDNFAAAEKSNRSLQKFLDLYRAEFALKMKIAGDDRYGFYRNSIADAASLHAKTRMLLSLPGFALQMMYRLKKVLEKSGFKPSAYH